jgi:quercetin dioxygenase-like cupin family protein
MNYFISFDDLPAKQLFPGIEARISHSDQVTLTRVTLEEGSALPEHHHVHEQWTTMLQGKLEMQIGGESKIMTPGMAVFIPSNTPHSARAITTCTVIDMFVPCREDFK